VVVALQNSTVHAPYEHNAPYKGRTAQMPPSDSRSERSLPARSSRTRSPSRAGSIGLHGDRTDCDFSPTSIIVAHVVAWARSRTTATRIPCSMRWSGCCTHTFAPCQHLCVRSQSHSECSPGRSGLTHVIRHQEPFYAFRRRPGKARGQRARRRGGRASRASAPRGRQGIGS
jgi:hypothetical protein